MADIKSVPEDLRGHAEAMPKDLRERMSQEELHYRLRHVHRLTEDAASIKNPTVSRHLTAEAGRVLKALPWYEYCEQKRRLEHGRDNTSRYGALSDLHVGYMDALKALDKKNPQAPGIGTHLDQVAKGKRSAESAAEGKGASGPMLYKRANIDRLVQAELKKYEAKHAAEVERIRREIAELEASAKTGRTATPLERARTTSKADELNAEADRLYKLADSLVGERDLARRYREKACEMREEALRLRGTK